MSIIVILFYWCNDTPIFVTWWSRLATAPDTPMCIIIHSSLAEFISQISSTLRLLVLFFVCPHLFVIHYGLIIFSKNLFLSSAPFTNATPAFSMLWFFHVILLTKQTWQVFFFFNFLCFEKWKVRILSSEQKSSSCSWVQVQAVNTLPNDKILDWLKLKAFADDKFNIC